MAQKILRRRPLAFGYKQRQAGCHFGTVPSRRKLTLSQRYFGLRGPNDEGSDNQLPSNSYRPLSQKRSGSSAQLGLSRGRAAREELFCVCVCLFVCLNPLQYQMYHKALFSDYRLCRAISSPCSNRKPHRLCFPNHLKKEKEKRNHPKGRRRDSPLAQNSWAPTTSTSQGEKVKKGEKREKVAN